MLAAGWVGGGRGDGVINGGLVDAARVGERGRGPALSPADAQNVPRTERIEGVGVVSLSGKGGGAGRILLWCWGRAQGGGPHRSVAARRPSNSEYGGRQWEYKGANNANRYFPKIKRVLVWLTNLTNPTPRHRDLGGNSSLSKIKLINEILTETNLGGSEAGAANLLHTEKRSFSFDFWSGSRCEPLIHFYLSKNPSFLLGGVPGTVRGSFAC